MVDNIGAYIQSLNFGYRTQLLSAEVLEVLLCHRDKNSF